MDIWHSIVEDLQAHPRDLQTTVKSDKKTPLWFHARISGKALIIENAHDHELSVKLSSIRRIYEKDFMLIYPFYIRRENGEAVSKGIALTKGEAKKNQTYIFGVIRGCAPQCDADGKE